MILMNIGNMRGKTVIRIFVVIIAFAVGWTSGQVLEDYSPFILDWSISVSDVLGILVEIGLALFLASLIEKGLQNQRVEKDFYISELDETQRTFAELGKECSRLEPLPFHRTIYQIEKPKKDLVKMWDTIGLRNKSFHQEYQPQIDELLSRIKTLNSQLSDSSYFRSNEGYDPVKIEGGYIFLNASVTPVIDESFSAIKERIFRMKIAINEL